MRIHLILPTRRNTDLVVLSAATKMPGKCWGVYRRVTVLECDAGTLPNMISERARGVRQIVATFEKRHAGRSWRHAREWNDPDDTRRSTSYERAIWRATDVADALALEWATDYPTLDVADDTRSTVEEF